MGAHAWAKRLGALPAVQRFREQAARALLLAATCYGTHVHWAARTATQRIRTLVHAALLGGTAPAGPLRRTS